ncbi:MAG: hypothetical protein AAF527_05240 [Pseudomonadota bacterium]
MRREISAIENDAGAFPELRDCPHELLFQTYRKVRSDLKPDDAAADGLMKAQASLMRTSARLPARTVRELLFKLALWRWESPDIDGPVREMAVYDAVAYTAFLDLAVMLSEPAVLMECDARRDAYF